MGWGRGRFGFSINYILISSPSPRSRRLQSQASRTPRPHDERENTIPQQLPPAGAYPLPHPPPLSKGHGLLEGNMPGEAASLWSLIDMGERISPFGNKCAETPGVMLREELDFHCYWSSLRFSRKHNSAKNIVRNKIKAAFWPGEHVVDKNLPSQRFHFRNALKPKSLDDTDIVAIVPTPLESPLKLPKWNVLGIFFLTRYRVFLAQKRLLLGPPLSGVFMGTISPRIHSNMQNNAVCALVKARKRRKNTKKKPLPDQMKPGAELRTDCCVYVKGCFHRWRFIWNPFPPNLRSAPNQLALDGLCEGGFQASGKANQNSQHVPGFMYF